MNSAYMRVSWNRSKLSHIHYTFWCIWLRLDIFSVRFQEKKGFLFFITKFVVIFFILALFGILSTIHLVAAIQPSQKYSSTIIHALETVLNRFYRTTTPTIFLTAQSSLTKSNGPNPYEMVGDLMRLKSKRIKMAYVVGNKIPDRYSRTPRFHNIFIVDSYESFR